MLEKSLKATKPAGAQQKGFHLSKIQTPDPWKQSNNTQSSDAEQVSKQLWDSRK